MIREEFSDDKTKISRKAMRKFSIIRRSIKETIISFIEILKRVLKIISFEY